MPGHDASGDCGSEFGGFWWRIVSQQRLHAGFAGHAYMPANEAADGTTWRRPWGAFQICVTIQRQSIGAVFIFIIIIISTSDPTVTSGALSQMQSLLFNLTFCSSSYSTSHLSKLTKRRILLLLIYTSSLLCFTGFQFNLGSNLNLINRLQTHVWEATCKPNFTNLTTRSVTFVEVIWPAVA